jgi:hypothetical protein
MPLGLAVLGALAGLLVLSLVAYVAVRVFSRVE